MTGKRAENRDQAASTGKGESATGGFRYYGRRQGRPFSAAQKAALAAGLARFGIPDGTRPLSLETMFGAPVARAALEIGFGDGEHLIWQAAHHANTGFVGVEPFRTGVLHLLEKIEAGGCENIRVFPGDARALMSRLPVSAFERIFVLFPDPWPKTRHHKRRLINHATLEEFARLVKPGGELRLATDHADYLAWILAHMAARPEFLWLAEHARDWRARPPDWPPTRYEAKAASAGRRAIYLTYRRR